MDTQRLILFFVFSFSLLLLWEAWQKETRPPQAQAPAPSASVPAPSSSPKAVQAVPSVPAQAAQPSGPRDRVRVKTDELLAEIDTQGGDIVYLELLKHKDPIDQNKNFVLLTPEYRYFSQSGLIGADLPNHKTLYATQTKEVTLAPGKDRLEVRLEASGGDGVRVAKTLTFHRGSHLIDTAHEITNAGQAPLAAHAYFQLTRNGKHPPGDTYMLQTFTGAAVFTEQDKYVKLDFGDIEKGKTPYGRSADNGWIGIVQHYFVSALLPAEKQQREYFTRKLADDYYSAGVIVPVPTIGPGATARVSVPLYAGPQEQDKLKAIAPGLDLVVDYGWLTIVAAPLFWVLQLFHSRWSSSFCSSRCRRRATARWPR